MKFPGRIGPWFAVEDEDGEYGEQYYEHEETGEELRISPYIGRRISEGKWRVDYDLPGIETEPDHIPGTWPLYPRQSFDSIRAATDWIRRNLD